MSDIIEIEREIDLRSATSRLQIVATGLKKLIDGEPLENHETEELNRTGYLFGVIDWNSEHYKMHESPQFCVTATRLRPIFYHQLINLGIQYDAAYCERIYNTLKSSGKQVALSPQELPQIQKVFQLMADEILSGLQKHSGHL